MAFAEDAGECKPLMHFFVLSNADKLDLANEMG